LHQGPLILLSKGHRAFILVNILNKVSRIKSRDRTDYHECRRETPSSWCQFFPKHPFLKKFKSHRLRMMILAIADEGRSATTVFLGGKFDCKNIHGGTN
jgi:hypothetical protein